MIMPREEHEQSAVWDTEEAAGNSYEYLNAQVQKTQVRTGI
jgi:hypothetical protein